MKQKSISLLLCLLLWGGVALAKQTENINPNWKFSLTDATDAGNTNFNDKNWKNVTLPYSWNALDGQDGGNNYFRGNGWYRKSVLVPTSSIGKTIYLKIGAANMSTSVFVNGKSVGVHTGGYASFAFDITPYIQYGENNLIAISVNNSETIISPPLSADFTFFGGITRDVELITADPVHLIVNDSVSSVFAKELRVYSPGIYIKQENVSDQSANIHVVGKLRNNGATTTAVLKLTLKDASGSIVKEQTLNQSLEPNTITALEHTFQITNPHLWDGLNDPYLYRVEAQVEVNGQTVDRSVQPLGIRYFSVDPNLGFFLNGKAYPLRGIAFHEEKKDKGRAVSNADRKEALDLLAETGCNYLRISHYQHGDYTYAYMDSVGIICWTEIPCINSVGSTVADNSTYRKNAKSQMYELIRQNINHPSICFWGVSNEINYKTGVNPVGTIRELNDLVKSEDLTRYSTLAAMYAEKETNWVPDLYACNRYDGWYYNTIADFGTNMDDYHAKHPDRKIGVSEYGPGGNTTQHEYPAKKPNEGGQYHPEEYQNLFHEGYLAMINARPYLWCSSLWVGFDFASDGRNEGSQPGINDKGMITFDRSIKKDIFYLYKANWNKKDYFAYISSRRFTERKAKSAEIKIYSNCESVKVIFNGTELGTKTSTDHIFLWSNITLKDGINTVKAIGTKDGKEYTDEVEWNYSTRTVPTVSAGDLQINFEKESTVTPAGYLKDAGTIFGDRENGYTYGWDYSADMTDETANIEKRFFTYGNMQPQNQDNNGWQIELPNGEYKISGAFGTPDFLDAYYHILANGITLVDYLPLASKEFAVANNVKVMVNDHRLSIVAGEKSRNAVFNFIHITNLSLSHTMSNTLSGKVFAFVSGNTLNIINEKGDNDVIRIFSVTGKKMISEQSSPSHAQIDISELEKGVYILQLNGKFGTETLKFNK